MPVKIHENVSHTCNIDSGKGEWGILLNKPKERSKGVITVGDYPKSLVPFTPPVVRLLDL
jgi:hypothetical protein